MEQLKLKVIRFDAEDIITASGYPGELRVLGADDTTRNNLELFAPGKPVEYWNNIDGTLYSYNLFFKQITDKEEVTGLMVENEDNIKANLSLIRQRDLNGKKS